MHFHLPKPLHGWREFAGEVGIIVIGVLIALTAEAFVERFHEKEQLRQAEERMTAEILDDDLPQAYARAAIGKCNEHALDAIETAVGTGDRTAVARLSSAYGPPFRTWDDDAWQAANASQALKSTDADRAVGWSGFFIGMPLMSQWTSDEQEALRQLRARLGGSGPLTTVQQDRLFQLIATLQGTNQRLTGGGLASMGTAKAVGIALSRANRRAILTEAHGRYGSCVSDPDEALRARKATGQYQS
jgi:hypothetical protein